MLHLRVHQTYAFFFVASERRRYDVRHAWSDLSLPEDRGRSSEKAEAADVEIVLFLRDRVYRL